VSSVHQVFLAVIRRFFESKFRKKSIVLRYDRKAPPNRVVLFFLNQRFEQGVSEAKKRPGGAFVPRCACRSAAALQANLSCCARKSITQQGGGFSF